MYADIKFKMINSYGPLNSRKLYSTKYYEILCEPSYNGDVLLLCTKGELTFEEVIYIILKKTKKIDIIGAISFIYYNYSELFFNFLKSCNEKQLKVIKKKCLTHFERLVNFVKFSDDTKYYQNEFIRKSYFILKNF